MQQYTYLIIDLAVIAMPLIFSFHPRILFYKQLPAFVPALFSTALLFTAWDAWFTQKGVWGFNSGYITGIHVFNLPAEEVLFFICIPYACIFTQHCLGFIKWFRLNPSFQSWLTPCMATAMFLVAGFNYHRWYTVSSFGFTALLLFFAKFAKAGEWLGRFYLAYLVIQLPFFIVNGLLTGHWLHAPVVWYNNKQNMGVRLTTIPVEDIFYGMGLLLLNNMLYQLFKRRLN